MILERLKALWALPTLLHNEGHTIADALSRLRETVAQAMNAREPEFVLVLLQGQYEDGAPFVAAMSGKHYARTLQLRYETFQPVKQFTALVFCNLERVRVVSIYAGSRILQRAPVQATAAPMAYCADPIAAGIRIMVELEQLP